MNTEQYYMAPSDDIFNDIKENAIKLWQTYDDTYGYATEKINRIKDIGNIKDNAWYIVAMFDSNNQYILMQMVKTETKIKIQEILTWGGKW
jgi:hypothetical protein